MQFRTPHCAFALRLDQIHPGIEVVILEVKETDVSVRAFGRLTTTPYPHTDWHAGFRVEVQDYFSRAYRTEYDARGVGLLPTVEDRGWCTHFTQDHIDQGIYTATEVHRGQECPNFYKEVTWSNTFVVKLKDAHRVLGCKSWETRELLREQMRDIEELREWEMLRDSLTEDDLD
jgi:hypothetical protein